MKETIKANQEENEFLEQLDAQLGGNMSDEAVETLKNKLEEDEYQKITRINNPRLYKFLAKYIELCNP
ncbi:MAG: hypothetical protein HOC20_07050, partial [Chloroflexi bacterium]|nr:hypothetical protein [Chloroflexota bacterium]